MIKLFKLEPYRVFFLLGSSLAILAVLPWILFFLGYVPVYPKQIHAHIMFLGFISSFVSGFLMTALPRMTNTEPAKSYEVYSLFILIFLQSVLQIFYFEILAGFISTAIFIVLISFVVRRFLSLNSELPKGFIFIPFGLMSALIGTLLLNLFSEGVWHEYGRILLYQAFILNLIVGLGSRLIPVLSRKVDALSPAPIMQIPNSIFVQQVLLINSTFIVEAFLNDRLAYLLRFVIILFVIFYNFRIYSKPVEVSKLGRALNLAVIFLCMPYLLISLFPLLKLHFLHIVFIAGFAMLTMLISMRVTLSHGGESLTYEKTSNHIYGIIGMLLLAMMLRAFGPLFYPQLSVLFFLLASTVWILALLYWQFIFGRKLLKVSAV